jgi:hypothetical protein
MRKGGSQLAKLVLVDECASLDHPRSETWNPEVRLRAGGKRREIERARVL